MPTSTPLMHPRKLLALVALAIALPFVVLARLPDTPRFGHEASDLKPEAGLRFGKLPNGLHYVVMANKEPKDRASLRLVILAGSLHEDDEQRGLAHFLEHMVFNGSTNYPPGTLVEFFQRMGMSFGGDTNAYTSFDHTAYMIELPDTKPATLDEGFRVFRDFAAGALLEDKELDRERGIILSEKRARDSIEYRQFVAEFDFVLDDTLLPKRMPIGLETVIEKAPRDRFASYYDTWYRPERMAIVAVGDFDPAVVEKLLSSSFSGLKARGAARPAPDLGKIAAFQGVRALYHPEPEASKTNLSIQTLSPHADEPDTAAYRLARLPRNLALAMLNRRLAKLSLEEGAPFTAGEANANEGFGFFLNASVDFVCKPELWRETLAVGEQELRRALEHGFQPAELAEAIANFRNDLDQSAKTASTRRSQDLARQLVSTLVSGKVFTAPEDDLKLYGPALDKITGDQCTAALRELFAGRGRYVSVIGNAKIDGDAVAAIEQAYAKSAATAVAAPARIEDARFAYSDFGAPGVVQEKRRIEDLDLTLVTFANGVRLNLKKTDFESNQIHVSVRVGVGRLQEPKDKPGLSVFANTVFTLGGLGRHNIDDLQRILAGKNVSAGFRAGSDTLLLGTFSAGAQPKPSPTNREDLLLQLQLLAAYVTDPGFRPEAVRVAKKTFEQAYLRLDRTSEGALRRDIPLLLVAGGDPRPTSALPPLDALLARTVDEARDWLAPQLARGPIEIGIAGDIDLDATIDAVAKTFGALPKRDAKPALEAERRTAFNPPSSREFTFPSELPKGVVALYWPTTGGRDIRIVRRLQLLAEVFTDRLRVKIREDLGEAYSARAYSDPSETFPDYGIIATNITVDPAKAARISEIALAIADDLATGGVTADELERAKKPILTMLRETARTNTYWLNAVLASVQEQPQRLDWCRHRYADNESVTTAELSELAKKYLPSARAFRFTIVPEKK